MNIFKIFIIFITFSIFNPLYAQDNFDTLNKLFQEGALTKEEFEKAKKKIIKPKKKFELNIFKKSKGRTKFDRAEILFDDFRLYTHRAGGVIIKKVSTNQRLVVFTDKFKIKYYNNGENIFDFILDEKNEKISVLYDGIEIIHWEGKYIRKHNAYFFQMLALGYKPFHYYILLNNGKQAGLNIDKFQRKIDKSVAKAKLRLAAKYNITLEQIDKILKDREKKITRELEDVVEQKEEEAIREATNDTIQKTIDSTLQREIKKSIGEAMAEEFESAIVDGMESELASIVNEAVAEAVNEGISAAAAEAGIRAAIQVLARGGSEQEAWDAGCAAAGQSSGC
jgi:hypothetical protein|tara:strand:+ start:203 stop:1216 length:1014 start_codon:yes stop_codon:yes gene_type:complete